MTVDDYGFAPRFAWTSGDRRCVATSLRELLDAGAPRVLDFDALAVFLRLGFFVGDDTPFAAIRAVHDGAQQAFRQPDRPAVRSRQEAVDAFIETFRSAIARRLPAAPFHLPLSGGRDSRHILLALIEAGCPPEACVTVEHFPPRGNDDVAVAAALCRRLNLRHIVLPQPDERVRAERDKNQTTHYCTDEHAQFVVLATHLSRLSTVTYDGIAGDVLSQSSYLTPAAHTLFSRGDAEACARHVLDTPGTVSERALSRLVSPVVLRQLSRERAIERLAGEIALHFGAANPVASFYFWNRTRREIALVPFALFDGLTVHTPYLDRDVVDLLSGLPAALLMDRTLHSEAIARAYPEVADQPYEARTASRHDPSAQRRLATALARTVLSSAGLLNRPALLPGILATIVDGDATRLWHTPLTIYLAQLGELVSLDR